MVKLTCFKAYDIRGKLGYELNENIAYRIGKAFGYWIVKQQDNIKRPLTVVIGRDVRLTSESLKQAVSNGLLDMGINVIDLGVTGTEEVYFATMHMQVNGGIEITASHNPLDYNGMKLVREEAKPISGDSGLSEIQRLAEDCEFMQKELAEYSGKLTEVSCAENYVVHLLAYINQGNIKPLKLVVNSGNGAAGHVVDKLEVAFEKQQIPISFIKVHHEPDGNFPNGIPNPLLPECREDTSKAVRKYNADMGIAWDGDFDRCFIFDEQGRFVEGYYIVGLLAESFLKKQPKAKIIHDPRLIWNTIDLVKQYDGQAIQSKTGHAFIKESMRREDAIYGGEMSAHHYFRDFAYCDSGMIPWLLVAELMSIKNESLSALVSARISKYPCSGEINFRVDSVSDSLAKVERYFTRGKAGKYAEELISIDTTDGLGMEFSSWRFNLRGSNTEPVLRLNVESRNNADKVEEQVKLLRYAIAT